MTTLDHPDATPDLLPGINRLDVAERRSPALARTVLAELRERDGRAFWIDARNNASTHRLHQAAAHDRLLAPLRIARAFTAYQHHRLVRTLARTVTPRTALVVAPAVADLYRDDDVREPEDRTFLEAALAILDQIGTVLEIPVLVSSVGDDDLAGLVADVAVQDVAVEATRFGYRFEGDGYRTQVYWDDGVFQTTIPYWVDLLGRAGTDPVRAADEAGLVGAEVEV